MKNVVGFVIGIGLFALKAVINPFGTAADLISNVADVWTEFAGDGAQKGIEKIAEKIKEKRDFNKIAEKFRSELSAIYEGAEGESLAEKIFRELADAENAERGKDSPEIFLRAAEMLGKEIKDCIVFEDTPQAIKTAKKAGFTVAAVAEKGKADDSGIFGSADMVIEDFTGVFKELEREAECKKIFAVH